jgi:hypothetical protein
VLRVPPDVVTAQCARYRKHGKPWHRSRLQNLDDYDIVRTYGAKYAGGGCCVSGRQDAIDAGDNLFRWLG